MAEAQGPLTGLRVVEFAGIGPGPHVAMLLADLGAQVVRIEREGAQVANEVVMRARHRAQIDMKSEAGKQFCMNALKSADVLIEGFRPGVMERLGLGPETVLEMNPRLVYARMTGWGQDGPLAQAAGHDINYIAITGALDAIGRKGDTATPPQNLVGDFGGGSMYCAFGILAALLERERSGKGQVVDAAIVDGTTSLMSFFFGVRDMPYLTTSRGEGTLSGGAHFYRCYKCADGREISVGAIEPQFYAELLQKSEAPAELAEGQLNPANWDEYTAKLAALFKTRPASEWTALLEGSDACFAPVLSLEEAREHPHAKARGMFEEHDGVWHTAPAPRFSRTPGAVRPSADNGTDIVAQWMGEGR